MTASTQVFLIAFVVATVACAGATPAPHDPLSALSTFCSVVRPDRVVDIMRAVEAARSGDAATALNGLAVLAEIIAELKEAGKPVPDYVDADLIAAVAAYQRRLAGEGVK